MSSTTIDRINGINQGVAIKAPCRVATTANITLSGTQTIDGIAVVADDRVLVKNQTSGVDNGIYVCSSSTWSRDLDFDGARDVITGTLVYVVYGTTLADTLWRVTTTGTITPGTTSIAFSQSSMAPSGSAYVAKVGDTMTGTLAMSGAAINTAAYVGVAASGTANIGAAASNNINLTGGGATTSFGTVAAGTTRNLYWSGATTLTYNATSLITPTAASITTAAGDTATAVSNGSGNWVITDYTRANGRPLAGGLFDINALSTITIAPSADYIPFYDASGATVGKTLASAITGIGQMQLTAFTGTGTFTTSANVTSSTKFKFTVTGGGGGGGAGATAQAGPGGGAGGTAIYWVSGLAASTGYAVTIGAAGAAGSAGAGGNGGNSTVVIGVTTVTGAGGVGGVQGTTAGASGGVGGTATNGTINISGGGGGACNQTGTTNATPGQGGVSFWGGAGPTLISLAGAAGGAYGSGGGGGGDSGAGALDGAAGIAGIVTVEWIE